MMAGYAAAKKPDKAQKEAITFVKRKVDAAKWFIDAINQRRNTLKITMEAIMEHQEAYFLTGDETELKPMILKDIAERHRHGHQHRVAGGQFEICPDPVRDLPAEDAVQRIPLDGQRGGGVDPGGQEDPRGGRWGGGQAQAAQR